MHDPAVGDDRGTGQEDQWQDHLETGDLDGEVSEVLLTFVGDFDTEPLGVTAKVPVEEASYRDSG